MKRGLLIIVVGMLFFCLGCQSNTEFRFLDTVRLVENFEMNKALLRGLENGLLERKALVDSQLAVLKSSNPSKFETEQMRQYEMLDQSQSKGVAEVQEAVWNRLNPLLREFGKARGYSILFGANGLGSIIYGEDEYDVTDEAIEYINRKYKNE